MKSALFATVPALALALCCAAGSALAATYDFTFTPSGPALIGNEITASGQFTTIFQGYSVANGNSFENIVSATGTVNGSAITGLDPNGVNVLLGETRLGGGASSPLIDVGFTTASGVTYGYDAGTVDSSAGDLGRDSFTLTVSGVPLPAGLPMFGAALLGLGAVGYVFKRNGKSTRAV